MKYFIVTASCAIGSRTITSTTTVSTSFEYPNWKLLQEQLTAELNKGQMTFMPIEPMSWSLIFIDELTVDQYLCWSATE